MWTPPQITHLPPVRDILTHLAWTPDRRGQRLLVSPPNDTEIHRSPTCQEDVLTTALQRLSPLQVHRPSQKLSITARAEMSPGADDILAEWGRNNEVVGGYIPTHLANQNLDRTLAKHWQKCVPTKIINDRYHLI